MSIWDSNKIDIYFLIFKLNLFQNITCEITKYRANGAKKRA